MQVSFSLQLRGDTLLYFNAKGEKPRGELQLNASSTVGGLSSGDTCGFQVCKKMWPSSDATAPAPSHQYCLSLNARQLCVGYLCRRQSTEGEGCIGRVV